MACVNHPERDAIAVRCACCLRAFCRDCVHRRDTFYYCAACDPAEATDVRPVRLPTRSGRGEVDSPQVIESQGLAPAPQTTAASLGRRCAAFVVDGSIVWLAVSLVLGLIEPHDQTARLLIVFGLALVYEALFVQQTGQTLGKGLLGIEVSSADGTPTSDGQAWTRGLIKIGQLGCCGATFAAALLSTERLGLHDRIAGTRVVRGSRRERQAGA